MKWKRNEIKKCLALYDVQWIWWLIKTVIFILLSEIPLADRPRTKINISRQILFLHLNRMKKMGPVFYGKCKNNNNSSQRRKAIRIDSINLISLESMQDSEWHSIYYVKLGTQRCNNSTENRNFTSDKSILFNQVHWSVIGIARENVIAVWHREKKMHITTHFLLTIDPERQKSAKQ